MTTNVHILATCLSPELISATTLVFKTLRTGFPDASVSVWCNDLKPRQRAIVSSAARESGCDLFDLPPTSHDVWIERMLEHSPAPFWVLDTDVVFFGKVEPAIPDAALCGRFEPAFFEPWSKTHKVERLHTSLLWLNPRLIHQQIRLWIGKWHPKGFPFTPQVDLIRQHYVPRAGNEPLFYDTCAGLYNAIGGAAFTDDQNAAFEHLHCGTYSDRIAVVMPGIVGVHKAVISDCGNAKGLSQQQSKFYQEHAIL